jgi:hypothetical protein
VSQANAVDLLFDRCVVTASPAGLGVIERRPR